MPDLGVLADWLRRRLGRERAPVLYRPGPAGLPVGRLALALEANDLPGHLDADALFLHRAFGLGERFAHLPVLASHDGFDARLTTGDNRPLATRLGWTERRPLTWQGRPIGYTARPPERDWTTLLNTLEREFGGHERLLPPPDPTLQRIALANATRPELLDLAHAQGASAYLTGQWRPGARQRAQELGMGIVALGHRRTEEWGLQQLARELHEAFPDLHLRTFTAAATPAVPQSP